MIITASCKVNLSLEVLGKRPDGYHNLYTVMQFLDMGDRVEVEPATELLFWCDNPQLNNNENLAVRAYHLLAAQYAVRPVAIRLHKAVPCMSGMGGGSADAAAVLRAVNSLSGLGLAPGQLAQLGKRLGADIPACVLGGINGGALLAQGIGEQITLLPQPQPLWYVVIKPSCSFSTPEMYARLDSATVHGGQDAATQSAMQAAVRAADAQGVAVCLYNSFEAVMQPRQPINAAKALLLQSGALGAAMSGAGSAVFGVFNGEAAARAGQQQVAATGAQCWLCRSAAT